MNSAEKFFTECAPPVDRKLDERLPAAETEPKNLHRAVRWSVFAGGKRFRPALVLAVGETFGAKRKKLLAAAAAIEMIHAYSLIHDDLPAMDDDRLRRGRATCHVKFGEATAILAGDVLQTLAFQTIAEDENLQPETRVRLISEIAKAAGTPAGMVAGQQLDLEAEGKRISIEHLEKIHQSKTGAIISVAAKSGAIIGKASESELEIVSVYAARLGLLFQITDDLLDVTETTETLGKTAGKDVSAQKATYVSLFGLTEARKLAGKIHAEAIEALSRLEKNTDLLKDLAGYILHRKK